MSISSEIERIQSAKSDIITALENKGVTVPTGATIDELPELIYSIPGGGGGGGEVIPEGYKKCAFVKNIDVGSIFSYTHENNPITNVSKDDIIKFYYEPGNRANSWIPETSIFKYYFSDTNSNRGVRIRTNTSENKSIIDAFTSQKTINEILKEASVEKKLYQLRC